MVLYGLWLVLRSAHIVFCVVTTAWLSHLLLHSCIAACSLSCAECGVSTLLQEVAILLPSLEAVVTHDGTVGRTKAARVKELNDLAKVSHSNMYVC